MKKTAILYFFIIFIIKNSIACLPTASFSSSYNGVFSFQNTSINADSVRWDFGDGTIDTSSTAIQHEYAANGFYNVQLIAYNSCGSDTVRKEVFTRSRFNPCETQLNMASLTVHFGPTIYYADSVVWTFANGDIFVGENPPPFTFDSAGIYSYKVELYNFLDTFYVDRPSSINLISHNVEVNSPSIHLDFDYEVLNSNVDVTFNSNYNYVEAYEWDFGDGNFSSEENPTHTYHLEGNYTVQLAIKSYECGILDTVTKEIQVQCELPQANFQFNQPDECDRTFEFNSTAINADSIYYSFGDGTGYYAENISHYYYSSGQYEVCQIAYNGCGADTICQTINIGPTTANPIFFAHQNDWTIPEFEFINLSDTATGYFWDFGNGDTSTLVHPTYTYTSTGFYDVCLTAYSLCDTQTFCQPIFIDCIVPEPEFSYAQPLSNNWTINFTTNITDADSIVWIINDSISYTGTNPSHTFPTHGDYEICQIVYACYNSDTICQNVEVACAGPLADFTYEMDSDTNFLFHFTDQSINGSSSFWDFGEDYDSSTLWSPSIFFDSELSHEIIHIVTNSCTSDTMIQTISACPPNNIVYINKNATGSNNGRNWDDAFTNFKSAFEFINRCTVNEVWVAEGTYFSDTSAANNLIEVTHSDLKIYGGFPNNGNPNFTDRNVEVFKTIISGNIGDTLSFLDNSKYFLGFTRTNSLIIDGLTFKEFVFGSSPLVVTNEQTFGSNLQINNCNFQKNIASYAAAINITKINKVQIQNTNFIDNIGTGHSRFNQIDSLEIENCLFTNNLENEDWGSEFNIYILAANLDNIAIENSKFNNKGISNFYSKRKVIELYSSLPTVNIKNCIVSNITTYAPSLVSLNSKNHIIENAVFYNNTANSVLLNYTQNTTFRNVIFNKNNMVNNRPISNNGVFENCLFDVDSCENVGGSAVCNSSSIFGTDAKFIDEQSENFKLKACSPAINAGTSNISTSLDFEGNNRPYQYKVDIGAYEWQGGYDELSMLNPRNVSSDIIQYADFSYKDEYNWTHYYDCDSNKILLSINFDGNAVPELNNGIQVGIKIKQKYGTNDGQDLSAANFHSSNNFYAMNRSWFVETNQQPLKPVKVRFYLHNIYDLNDVANMYFAQTGRNDINHLADLVFYKLSGTNDAYDTSISTVNTTMFTYSNQSDLNHFTINDTNGIHYVEFEVNSFSAGSGGAMANSGLLPVELINFEVKNIDNNYAALQWQTASESNNKGFVIERSEDAINFETIAWVDGHGNSSNTHQYNFDDINIKVGKTYYYRLIQTDFDGTLSYSDIETVKFESDFNINIYPNPTSSFIQINSHNNDDYLVQIFSFDGQLAAQITTTNLQPIDVSDLPNGQYFIQISNSEIATQKTIQIIH